MMLYHGSYLGGLSVIAAKSVSHATGKRVAYLITHRASALVYCLPPSEHFVTAGIGRDGVLHYFERFPNQLETMYRGKVGYLYTVQMADGVVRSSKPLAYESETDVPVQSCERIEDVYAALQAELARGTMTLHRYEDIDPAEQKKNANDIRDHLDDEVHRTCRTFLIRHFSTLWDEPMRITNKS